MRLLTAAGDEVNVKGPIEVDPKYCLHEWARPYEIDGGFGVAMRCKICKLKLEAPNTNFMTNKP